MVCFTKWRKNWVSAAAIAHWSAVHMIYTPWPSVFKKDTQCVRWRAKKKRELIMKHIICQSLILHAFDDAENWESCVDIFKARAQAVCNSTILHLLWTFLVVVDLVLIRNLDWYDSVLFCVRNNALIWLCIQLLARRPQRTARPPSQIFGLFLTKMWLVRKM